VFSHLNEGDKVAIISRYGQGDAQQYVDALQARGLRVRFVSDGVDGPSGLQDFCFLMHAKKEAIGMAISTFFMWASLLGNCPKVVAYSVDNPQRRVFVGDGHHTYNFTNPTLAGRFSFPLISPTDSAVRQ
jgi:hypothetical protein